MMLATYQQGYNCKKKTPKQEVLYICSALRVFKGVVRGTTSGKFELLWE